MFLITGLPNLFIFGWMRADQAECLGITSKSPAEVTMLNAPNQLIRNINLTIPNSLFYAQHVVTVRSDKRVNRAEITSTVRSSRRENLKDLVMFSESRLGVNWLVNYRSRAYMFQKGCATIDVEIVLPITGVDSLNLNIPASAQVVVDSLVVKSFTVNQRVATIKIPMGKGPKEPRHPKEPVPAPLPVADVHTLEAPVKHKRPRRPHGIHRKILSWGRRCFGKRPAKRPFRPDPRFIELFAPKFINFTKSGIEQLSVRTHQKIVLRDYSCSMTGKLNLVALQTNLTRVAGCETITINATEQYLNSVTADRVVVSSGVEKSNIELFKIDAKHIIGNLVNGNMKFTANPSTLVDLERKTMDGEINVNLPEIVWFRNSDLVKQGKWKCGEECTHDIKMTVSNKGTLQLVE